MSKVTEFYIEEGFAKLAGPYNLQIPKDKYYLDRVIDDMRRGNIEWRIVNDERGMAYIERTGMILSRSEK